MDADDLTAYLARIGVSRPSAPEIASLAAIHWGHVSTIPFENLDILLGRRIALDLPSLVAKLVHGGRGGYCFEQNALLAAVLEELGFGVTRLAGRVRWLATGISPRTHMLLAVDVPGTPGRFLVDGGFGGTCPTAPIPLVDGAEVTQHHDRYRLIAEGHGHVVQVATGEGWSDMYWFTLEPQEAIDYEVANHYTSTHPQSRFMLGLMCARTTAEGRVTVRGNELVRRRGQGAAIVEREVIADGEQLLEVLARELGVRFPSGTRFRHGPA
ncbi:MAG TPA: arylamine N-acetyltransferase [Kofleriaceae bacterium]|nr:arylamine N-acetyltransferase [Kofleriaceae bacterium]